MSDGPGSDPYDGPPMGAVPADAPFTPPPGHGPPADAPPPGQKSLAEQAAGLADNLRLFAELANGHKVHLESLGWSPAAAEQVAAQVHMLMNAKAFN